MMKACGKCGRIHGWNHECSSARRSYRATDERKERSTYAWTEKSKEIRESANGLCEVCRAEGKITYKGLEVHHITKLRDNPSGLLDSYNLVCLCVEHHKQADEGKISSDYLRELAIKREADAD